MKISSCLVRGLWLALRQGDGPKKKAEKKLKKCTIFTKQISYKDIFALLVYYAASSGNHLPRFRDFLTLEYVIDTLSRNVGKGLPHGAA
jgi:hypothetical protein